MNYNYPSVRLILPEERILPVIMYQIGLFAIKSINRGVI